MTIREFRYPIYYSSFLANNPPVDQKKFVGTNFDFSQAGVKNPKWRSQVRKHVNATTPYSAEKLRIAVVPGWGKTVTDVPLPSRQTEIYSGQLVQNFDIPSLGSIGNVENDAYSRFVRNANRELRSLQGLVSLGELREAIHMIRHPLDSLKNGFSDYLKETPKRARQASRGTGIRTNARRKAIGRAISGTYLEYANGWAPFINDVKSASKVLADHFNPNGIAYRKIRAEASSEPVSSFPVVMAVANTTFGGALTFWRNVVTVKQSSCRIIGEVIVSSRGNSADLLRNAGFRLPEFIPTVWELLPLSYVADYFTNMGDILEAYAFDRGSVAWFCKTSRRTATSLTIGIFRPAGGISGSPGYLTYSANPGSTLCTRTGIVRTDSIGWTPSLVFSLPGTHLIRRLANVSSLFIQARSSSRQINRLLNG